MLIVVIIGYFVWKANKNSTQYSDVTIQKEQSSGQENYVKGRHFTEHVETVKLLKRESRYSEALELLDQLIAATESESAWSGGGVAPWYYAEIAKIHRRRKEYVQEISILERYMKQKHSPGAMKSEIEKRLERARELLRRSLEETKQARRPNSTTRAIERMASESDDRFAGTSPWHTDLEYQASSHKEIVGDEPVRVRVAEQRSEVFTLSDKIQDAGAEAVREIQQVGSISTLSIYIPKSKLDLRPIERMQDLAERQSRSVNYLVVEAVLEYLDTEEDDAPRYEEAALEEDTTFDTSTPPETPQVQSALHSDEIREIPATTEDPTLAPDTNLIRDKRAEAEAVLATHSEASAQKNKAPEYKEAALEEDTTFDTSTPPETPQVGISTQRDEVREIIGATGDISLALDTDLIRAKEAETEVVLATLSEVFAEEGSSDDETDDDEKGGSENRGRLNLNRVHEQLLLELLRLEELPLDCWDAMCEARGLLPNATMEMINDAILEVFDDVLIVGRDPLIIDADIGALCGKFYE